MVARRSSSPTQLVAHWEAQKARGRRESKSREERGLACDGAPGVGKWTWAVLLASKFSCGVR